MERLKKKAERMIKLTEETVREIEKTVRRQKDCIILTMQGKDESKDTISAFVYDWEGDEMAKEKFCQAVMWNERTGLCIVAGDTYETEKTKEELTEEMKGKGEDEIIQFMGGMMHTTATALSIAEAIDQYI